MTEKLLSEMSHDEIGALTMDELVTRMHLAAAEVAASASRLRDAAAREAAPSEVTADPVATQDNRRWVNGDELIEGQTFEEELASLLERRAAEAATHRSTCAERALVLTAALRDPSIPWSGTHAVLLQLLQDEAIRTQAVIDEVRALVRGDE